MSRPERGPFSWRLPAEGGDIYVQKTARVTPPAIADLTGTWTLDPGRTTIRFQTKAMWVLNVSGPLRATEGSCAVEGGGQATGRLVLDASSIDTRNRRRDAHLRGADFFEVRRHPIMVFDVTEARIGPQGQIAVRGPSPSAALPST